jgi:putative DNA primase/helicase
MSHPPPHNAQRKNEECSMHSTQKQTLTKAKHMITERNADTAELNSATKPHEITSSLGTRPFPPDTRPTPPSATSTRENGQILLDELETLLNRFVILPAQAPETLALWILHTYAFELRDVSTYLGVESPEKRCGKTTLLSVLNRLVNRPVAAANISPSAFFRAIEEMRPTLLIDEADTFLRGNDELRGILNAGYTRDTAYVVRVTQTDVNPLHEPRSSRREEAPFSENSKFEIQNSKLENRPVQVGPSLDTRHSSLGHFSCWCPKVMAAIGRLPDTLADRCIVIRMQRKTIDEECARLRNLNTTGLRERCIQFVKENHNTIAAAQPQVPESLNDRAADIWEPLLVLADIAGGEWPTKARRAAQGLSANSQSRSPIGSLLFDIFCGMCVTQSDRISSHDLVNWLNRYTDRPWQDLPGLRLVDSGRRKEITELWLSQQLRPYGIRPKTIRIGDRTPKGYVEDDMLEMFQRYVPRSELDEFKAERERQTAERSQQRYQNAPTNRQ